MNERLADICVEMSGEAAEPCIYGVHRLPNGHEAAFVQDAFGFPHALINDAPLLIVYDNRRRQKPERNVVGAELLQRGVRIRRLIISVRVYERACFIEQRLLDDCGDGFAFGEPLAAVFGEFGGRPRLVHGDKPRCPAIGKCERIKRIQKAGFACRRKTEDGNHP